MDRMEVYFKPIFDGVRLSKNLNLLVEIIDHKDHTEFEIRISGLKKAPAFAFTWVDEDETITYSALYDLKEDAELENDFVDKLTGPFTELRYGKGDHKVELIGKIDVKNLTADNVKAILYYLKHDKSVIGKLWSISVDSTKEDESLKGKCDEAMFKVYLFFRTYGSGFIDHIYRFFDDYTMHDIKSSINTLELIGLVDHTEDDEYVIKESKVSQYINKEDIIDVINKEIKHYEN